MTGMQISYAKLSESDRAGTWGVKVSGNLGGRATQMAGETVEVRKRDGKTKQETLGRRLYSWNAGRAAVYAIQRESYGALDSISQPYLVQPNVGNVVPATRADTLKGDCIERIAALTDEALDKLADILCAEKERRTGYAHVVYTP